MALAIKDGTGASQNLPTVADAAGNLIQQVSTDQVGLAHYRATSAFSPAVTAASDTWIMNGSATKTIRIKYICISGVVTTTPAVQIVSLLKRSTANAGGTTAAATLVPLDSANVAATATVLSYTVVPVTPGTLVGTVGSRYIVLSGTPLTATDFPPSEKLFFDFTTKNDQALVLRGVAQGVSIQFPAALPAGIALAIEVEWDEDAS